jgi:hypothetical protein
MPRSAKYLLGPFLLALAGSCVYAPGVALADDEGAYYEAEEETLFGDTAVSPVAFQQGDTPEDMGMGGMTAAPSASRYTARRTGPTGSRQANIRLASIPNMYGDIGMSMGQIVVPPFIDSNEGRVSAGIFDIPSAGGSRRVKIGDNNVALPTDRVFFMYNHFHNVFQFNEQPLNPPGAPPINRQMHLDRYTAGFEKMFLDDLWSVEVRMPFNGSFDYRGSAVAVEGGNVGNLAIILKNLLYVDDNTAVAAGLGIDIPTGSDVTTSINGIDLHFQNDALHLLPWIGFTTAIGEQFFMTGFLQVDIAANGNEVLAPQFDRSLGFFTEQNLMYLDLAVGTWLYNNPYAERLTSVALLGELHYTTTLQDTDVIEDTVFGSEFFIGNVFNRQDILNGTVAVQFEIANTTNFRFAAVTPLSNSPDRRLFDSELQFQVNRKF